MKINSAGFLICMLLFLATAVSAQPYSGERRFDGVHRHECSGYLLGGHNVVTDTFVGEAVTYTRHLTDRWSVSAGQQIQFFKQLYSLDVMGTYRLPAGRSNLYFDGRFLFNRYDRWNVNEPILNLSMLWESPYVDIRIGESYIHYRKNGIKYKYRTYTDAGYSEPLTMTFGVGVNVKDRSSAWNLGLFLRNYDHFYYENWNINWGVRFYASLPHGMKLFGEFNIRPAGSLSQLATRYETSLKLGLRHAW